MILLAVDLESSLETTSNFIGRGEDGIDASFLFLGFFGVSLACVNFFGDTILFGLLVPSAFTLVIAPADPEVFVSIYAVVESEGGS